MGLQPGSAWEVSNGRSKALSQPRCGINLDDVHYIRGKHTLSAGVWVQRAQQYETGAAQGSAGAVAYPTVLAFLQDKPSQAILVRNPIPVGFRTTEIA